jgi:hypothetical protein
MSSFNGPLSDFDSQLVRFSTMPQANSSKNQRPMTTPVVFVNSNAHGQIKSDQNYNLELVNRRKIPDMTIIEINIAKPTVVNILDDETVHNLYNMIIKKINAIKPKNFDPDDYNEQLIIALSQADKEYKIQTRDIIKKQVFGQLENLIDDLKQNLEDKSAIGQNNIEKLESFLDEDGSPIIEKIRDRIHFVISFLQKGMFDYNFYSRYKNKIPMLKIYFSGDELTSVPQNWRILAEELYEVPTTLRPGVKTFATIPEIIAAADITETNYISGNSVDLLRYLTPTPPTTIPPTPRIETIPSSIVRRNGAAQITHTNEDIYEYLYKAGYRKVIMFNNSCATAINIENYEIIDLRTLRVIRKNAEEFRKKSFIPLTKSKLREKLTDNFEVEFSLIKKNLEKVLRKYAYNLNDARINMYNGGSKSKSNRKSKRSNKKSKRRNNRKTYKKKLRKTYKKRR